MATRAPLVYRSDLGHPGAPAPGDTLDQTYLPPSAAAAPTNLAAGTSFTVAAGTQVPWGDQITVGGQLVVNGALRGVR